MLKIAKNFELPDEAVTQTFAILAKRGVGKTYTASVMVEEMLKNGLHVVVVDPIGVWWGLRTSADGKKPGQPIIVMGGDHGDLPLEHTSGELIANLIVDRKLPLVIDLSIMRKGEQKRFMIDFAEALYHKNREALHLVLDEADEFAPQRPMGDDARMLGAIEDLVRRGRARGIGVTLITQRPAVLNKNVLTQIEVLIAMRLTSPQDRQALNEWVKYHADTESANDMITSLPSLPIGTAWIWSPGWLDLFKKVAIRKRETLDSSSTPKVGETAVAVKKIAKVDLEELREQLTSTIEKAQSEDPKLLRRRIVELEKELANRKPKVEIKEVEIVSNLMIAQLEELIDPLHERAGDLLKVLSGLKGGVVPKTSPPAKLTMLPADPVNTNAGRISKEHKSDDAPNLRAGERRILETLGARYPMKLTRAQLGTLSRFKHTGGTFGTYFGTLKRSGYISENSGEIVITETGLQYLGDAIPNPMTTDEVLNMWRNALRAGERAMLDKLVEIYPAEISRDDLGQETGFTASGGTFGTYLGSLRRNGLIEVDGSSVRASDSLFIGGK